MSKKTIVIDGIKYVQYKDAENDTPKDEVETPVNKSKDEPKDEPKEPVDEPKTPDSEDVEKTIQEASKKVMTNLGFDVLTQKIDDLNEKLGNQAETTEKKVGDLVNLEDILGKSKEELTVKEKVVGFFQAAIQNNKVALKALSEGTTTDGGFLFPELKFIGELKLGELLGRPLKRIISSQALPVMA